MLIDDPIRPAAVFTTGAFTDTAVRQRWTELPAPVRASVEHRLGARVRRDIDQRGGFTHGVAARLVLADGSRAFVKAIPADDRLADNYRAEAWCAERLPAGVPAPRLRLSDEADGWVILGFDDVRGRNPDLARLEDLAAVLDTVTHLAEVLTPNPVPDAAPAARELASLMDAWRTFAADGPPADLHPWARRNLDRLAELERGWAKATAGDTLLHADLRPDDMLLTATGGTFVVDWACACVGAVLVDLAVLLGSVAGVDPEAIVASHPVTRDVAIAAIDEFVCALAGCWERVSREPARPRSPYLRSLQARNAVVTRAWLARRTGWR